MALFGLFGKKKQQIDKIDLPSDNSKNPYAPPSFGYNDPVIPNPPNVDDLDVPMPSSKKEIPKFDFPKDEPIDIPDIKLEDTSESGKEVEQDSMRSFNGEMIKRDDLSSEEFDADSQPEFDSLKKAVGEPVKSSDFADSGSTSDEDEIPNFDDSNAPQGNDFNDKYNNSTEDNNPEENFSDETDEENETEETEEADEQDSSLPEKAQAQEEGEEYEIPDFFGPETSKNEKPKTTTELPSFEKIQPVKQDNFLPSFGIRETKSNEQLFIDARDYEKLLREINSVDLVAKRTVKELMKIKDVSGNEAKLFAKYHADLEYINSKLAYIDSVLFEQ